MVGNRNRTTAEQKRQRITLKPATARRILIRALEMGHMSLKPNFEERYDERCFTTVDAEMLIRHGTVIDEGRHDKDFDSFVFRITGKVDGRTWELLVALECEEDYWESPCVTIISARQPRRPKNARRKKVREEWRTYEQEVPSMQGNDGG